MSVTATTTDTGAGEPSRLENRSPRPRGAQRFTKHLEAYALLILTLGMVVFFSVWPVTADLFPTVPNVKILLASQAIIGLVAVGVLLPLIALEFDLSIGATAALVAVFVSMMLTGGMSVWLAAVIGLCVGLVVGIVNALITTVFGISGIVTTLGTSTILVGVLTHVTDGLAPTSRIPKSFTSIGNDSVANVPISFIILIVVAAIVYFVLDHTPFGRNLYASGSNPRAAELVGIRISRMKVAAFVICGALAAVGGILYVARAGGANPKISTTFLLPALAAAFLSAAAIKPGRYNVWGTIVAIYFLAVMNNGLSLAGAPPYVSNYSNGLALILGVVVATVLRRRSKSR